MLFLEMKEKNRKEWSWSKTNKWVTRGSGSWMLWLLSQSNRVGGVKQMQVIHSKKHDCALGLLVEFSLAFRFWTVSFALLFRGTLSLPNCFIFCHTIIVIWQYIHYIFPKTECSMFPERISYLSYIKWGIILPTFSFTILDKWVRLFCVINCICKNKHSWLTFIINVYQLAAVIKL